MKRDLEFPKPYQFVKSEKYEEFSKLLIWVASARHGHSLVVRRVLPGRVVVVLFWTKYAVLVKLNLEFSSKLLEEAKTTLGPLALAFFLSPAEKKAIIVSFRSDNFDWRSQQERLAHESEAWQWQPLLRPNTLYTNAKATCSAVLKAVFLLFSHN